MIKKFSVVLAVLVLVLVCSSVAFAAWTDSIMYVAGYPELTIKVSPSWTYDSVSNLYEYSYRLTNTTQDEYIEGFTLAFPSSIPQSGLTPVEIPTGWQAISRQKGNKINWVCVFSDQIAPSESLTFKFKCVYAPGTTKDVSVSAQNTVGFSGVTYGPVVPEPGSLVTLLTGLVGFAGLRKRK